MATLTSPDDVAAFVAGMARWRIAIDSQPHADFERDLRNTYLCVDADVVSMYTNPGSAAGYFGLRYYGAGSSANADDFASAAFLAGGLAQFILFELEGKQSSVEPRLALPAHAQEIQRAFHRVRNIANFAYQQALRDLGGVREKAQALLQSASGDAKEQSKLTASLRDYLKAWLGQSSSSVEPTGLSAVEQALRFGELFAVPENATDNPYPEQIIHVSRYCFGAPISDYLPEFRLANSKVLRQRAKDLQVDDRHLERIVREVEEEDASPSSTFNTQQLKIGTDAYALAWLDSVTQHLRHRYAQTPTQLKLISGSERLARWAPEHVVSPMTLMRLYLRSKLKADGAHPGGERHPAISRLKSTLDAVLGPLAFADGRYSSSEYVQWCYEQSDYQHVRNWGGLRDINAERLSAVVAAWSDVTNLLSVTPSSHLDSAAPRQSIVKQLEELESTIPSIPLEKWLSVIARCLELAERELMASASRLSLLMNPVGGNRPASRNPPPLRLSFSHAAQEIASKAIWQYSYDRDSVQREKIDSVLRQLQSTKYVVLLLGGLLRCATGDWVGSKSFFDMALSAAKDSDSKAAQLAAIEAAYSIAVASHVGAHKNGDLDVADASLKHARKLLRAHNQDARDIRFDTEEHSIELIRLWAKRAHPMSIEASDAEHSAAVLCAKIRKTFFHWMSEEEKGDHHEQYVANFCLQELACAALQSHWLSGYAAFGKRLLKLQRPGEAVPPPADLAEIAEWLVKQCNKLRRVDDHSSPMVTTLVDLHEVLARKLILGQSVDEADLERAGALSDDVANLTIPLVDAERFLFLRLLLRESPLV